MKSKNWEIEKGRPRRYRVKYIRQYSVTYLFPTKRQLKELRNLINKVLGE